MADPQDQPDGEPDGAPKPPAKKAPAKKAPAKKAPAKKAPAKKAPAKKAPAKKAPAKKVAPPPPQRPESPGELQQRIETNGEHLASAAKDVAAQAKSNVDSADDPVPPQALVPSTGPSPLPLAVAIALSLLALLLIRQLRRR